MAGEREEEGGGRNKVEVTKEVMPAHGKQLHAQALGRGVIASIAQNTRDLLHQAVPILRCHAGAELTPIHSNSEHVVEARPNTFNVEIECI